MTNEIDMEQLQKQNKDLLNAFKFWRAAALFMLLCSFIITLCTGLTVRKLLLSLQETENKYQSELESAQDIRDMAVEQLGRMAQKVEQLETELDALRSVQTNQIITEAETQKMNIIEDCTITYYCAEKYSHICGLGLGITATGAECEPGQIVAVDPNVIPLHSKVVIDYGDGDLHYYWAEDVGGSIKGNHIDVMVETHKEALDAGKRTATVYWIE